MPDRLPRNTKTMNSPWSSFLEARARCLQWLRDEMGETPEESAHTMSMDARQVLDILTYRERFSNNNGVR